MVQFTDHSQFGILSLSERPDLYWKLDSGKQDDVKALLRALKSANFPHNSNTSQARLQELYIHCQRGLKSYETMKLPELQLCAAQRGLPVAVDQGGMPWSLKTQLEQADEEVSFNSFLDLLTELRLKIYTLYFKSFIGTRAYIESQPPITGVSKAIRHESLSAFYGCCNFRLDINDVTITRGLLICSPETDRFLERTTADHFGLIRVIDVHFHYGTSETRLHIDLCNKITPVKAVHQRHCTYPSRSLSEQTLSDLRGLVLDIAAREGDAKLRKDDLKDLHEILRINFVKDTLDKQRISRNTGSMQAASFSSGPRLTRLIVNVLHTCKPVERDLGPVQSPPIVSRNGPRANRCLEHHRDRAENGSMVNREARLFSMAVLPCNTIRARNIGTCDFWRLGQQWEFWQVGAKSTVA